MVGGLASSVTWSEGGEGVVLPTLSVPMAWSVMVSWCEKAERSTLI